MSQEDAQVVRKAIEAFSRGGIEASIEYYAPDIEYFPSPVWLEDRMYRGHDGMRELASLWTTQFDEFRLDLQQTIDAGDHVVALIYQRGRIKGSADQIEQPVGYDCELRDGRVVRVHGYVSWQQALEAAGLPGEA